MSIASPSRLQSVQALRGIAAFAVLIYHMAAVQRQYVGGGHSDLQYLSGIWDQGWAGVDLFFVISGFIMVYVTVGTGRKLKDIGGFLWSRVTRIYPLWWLCAGFMAAYFWVSYGMPAAPDRVSGPEQAFAYALKSLLLLPQDSAPILGLGWSLIHEMFFYCVFAIILCIPRKYWLFVFAAWAVATVIGSLFIGAPAYARNFTELLFSPLSLEFIAGAFVGWAFIKELHLKPKLCLGLGMLMSVIGFVFYERVAPGGTTVSRVAIFTLPFAALIFGWATLERAGRASVPAVLARLGDWSYALYLTHYIVLVFLRRIMDKGLPEGSVLKLGTTGIWDNIIFALVALILSLATACVVHILFEKPVIRLFRKLRPVTAR